MASVLFVFVLFIVVFLPVPGLSSPSDGSHTLDAGCVIPLYTSVIGDVIVFTNNLLSEEEDILEKTTPSKSIGALLGAVHGVNRVNEYIKMGHGSKANSDYTHSGRRMAEDAARRVISNSAHVLEALGADVEEFNHMLNACRVDDNGASAGNINANDLEAATQYDIVCNKGTASSLASLDAILNGRFGIDVRADIPPLLHSDIDNTVKNRYLQAVDNVSFDELEVGNMSYEDLSSALDALLEGEELGNLDDLFMDVSFEASGPDHDYLYGAEEASYVENHAADYPDNIDGFALGSGAESIVSGGRGYDSNVLSEVAAEKEPDYNNYDIVSHQPDAIKTAVDSTMLSMNANNNIVTPYSSLFINQPSLLHPVRIPAALSRLTGLSVPASAPAAVTNPLQGLLAGARIPNAAGLVNNVRASAGMLGPLVGSPVAASSLDTITNMGFPAYPAAPKAGGLRGAFYR